jgi:predicted RNA-binding Zn-ribbon protein involved in translation (DUF1610 family)
VATVKADCPMCGPVRLRARQLTVRICVDDEHHAYRFHCPHCTQAVVRDASVALGALLVAVGAAQEEWRRPAELDESHDGEPLTADDLRALRRLLARDDWQERIRTDGAPDLA